MARVTRSHAPSVGDVRSWVASSSSSLAPAMAFSRASVSFGCTSSSRRPCTINVLVEERPAALSAVVPVRRSSSSS